MEHLVGKSSEATIGIEGISTSPLLDTGSSVSTVSQDFYQRNLSHLDLHQIDQLLKIECADGQPFLYLGYIKADIAIPGISKSTLQPCLLLVVPQTNYSATTPILLGTNFLSSLLETCGKQLGPRCLQTISQLSSWYLALRCISLREKQLSRHCNRIAVVRSAEHSRVTIKPNEQVVVRGFIDKCHPYHQTCALLQPHPQVSSDLDLTPSLISYRYKDADPVEVTFSNLSTHTVTLNPKTVLCEVQPVTITTLEQTSASNQQDSLLSQVDLKSENLSKEQQVNGKKLIHEFEDIFSKNEEEVGFCSRVRHRIDLHNYEPFKQRHRMITPSMLDEVRSHLQQLLASGVIRRSHSPWASNIVLARRKDGRLRMCTDFRQLNSRTVKDAYALPRVEEILDCLAGSQYFSVLDTKNGYYQVEIEESHKERTAFTVGPLGFYQYNRLPFGLTNSRLMEDVFGDYHLKICLIYLDDLIIFSRTYEEHMDRLRKVFQRIREAGLKLAPKKCHFFREKVVYVGHTVSKNGIEPDPAKT